MSVNCPKCETQLRSNALRCPVCGTPQAMAGFRPDPHRKAEPVLDPLLDLFTETERIHICPECQCEFQSHLKNCKRCRRKLEVMERADYQELLSYRPIFDAGVEIAAGPKSTPRDLVRIRIAVDLEHAEELTEELRFVGLEAWPGSDTLDPFDQGEAIGIYVRVADREAAVYLVETMESKDPLDEPPGGKGIVRSAVERSRALRAMGKSKAALAALEGEDAEEVDALKAEILLEAGRIGEARRFAKSAASLKAEDSPDRGRLLTRSAIINAMGPDGEPFGKGADLSASRRQLEEAIPLVPRLLDAGKALLEVLEQQGDKEAMSVELKRLNKFCPNLFGHAGPFRILWESYSKR